MKCEVCKTRDAKATVCAGDGQAHHHGAVHSIITPGHEGDTNFLAYLCPQCALKDRAAWDERRLPRERRAQSMRTIEAMSARL